MLRLTLLLTATLLISGCSYLPELPADKKLVITLQAGDHDCEENMQEADAAVLLKYFNYNQNNVTTCVTAVDGNLTLIK